MEYKDKVLEAMRKAGEALNAGKIVSGNLNEFTESNKVFLTCIR